MSGLYLLDTNILLEVLLGALGFSGCGRMWRCWYCRATGTDRLNRVIIPRGWIQAGGFNSMSRQEYEEEAEAIRRAADEVCKSRESALQFLINAGIVTASGELTEAYH